MLEPGSSGVIHEMITPLPSISPCVMSEKRTKIWDFEEETKMFIALGVIWIQIVSVLLLLGLLLPSIIQKNIYIIFNQ